MGGVISTSIDLQDLGDRGEQIDGPQDYAQIGVSVASAGDFNNDGIEDFLFTGPVTDEVNLGRGVTYLIFGKEGGIGPLDLATLATGQGFAIYGPPVSYYGDDGVDLVAASAGDVNGDGYDDLAIGAPRSNTEGHWNGRTYIVYGNAAGTGPANLGAMTAAQGSTISTLPEFGSTPSMGGSVAGVGDVNNDGYDDVLVGAATSETGDLYESGAAYLLFGSAAGIGNLNVTSMTAAQGYALTGAQSMSLAGYDVAGLGDVNGDGLDDFAITLPVVNGGQGAVVVRYGISGGSFAGGLAPTAAQGFTILGVGNPNIGSSSGSWLVSGAGDVNADGYEDILVSDYYQGGNASAFIVWGRPGGFATVDLNAPDLSKWARLYGPAAPGGGSLSAAGDVNGDGYDDVAIGVLNSGGISTNYVMYGGPSPAIPSIYGNGLLLRTDESQDYLGASVGSADVDGDGFTDVLAGAWGSDLAGFASGAVYLVYGDVPTAAVVRTGTVASQTLAGGAFADTLNGLGGHDDLYGNAGNDALNGGAGNDKLKGGAGVDAMVGGTGDDTYYVDDAGDTVTEAEGEGYDRVFASASWTLAAGQEVEELATNNAAAIVAINLTGNAFANRVAGNAGANTLGGGAGNDTLVGGAGVDVLDGGDNNDVLVAGNAAAAFVPADDLGLEADTLMGGGGDDVVWAGIGDFASGGAGIDTLNLSLAGDPDGAAITTTGILGLIGFTGAGGAIWQFEIFARLRGSDGDDVLQIAAQATTLIVEAGDGNDTVVSMGASLDARGGAGDDQLWSSAVGGIYDGGIGTDLLNFNDAATAVSATLALVAGQAGTGPAGELYRNIENVTGSTHADTLTGNNEANVLDGNLGADVLNGLGGNDTLRGGEGIDTMTGGLGDDVYWIEDAGDQVFESAGAGYDSVLAYVSYALPAGQDIERLELRSTIGTTLSLTGNELANELHAGLGPSLLSGAAGDDVLVGKDSNDRLDGGTGADIMGGALGDDLYVVDNQADMVLEVPGTSGGVDTVEASISYSLATVGAENIVLTGSGNIDGTGNGEANAITGNAGANKLAGAGGDDTMTGGLGDDTYYVDSPGDVVNEYAGQGNDTIVAAFSYTLAAAASIENLATIDPAATTGIALTGNGGANSLIGNAGNNSLYGSGGNDTLIGLEGDDILNGGIGTDTMSGGLGNDWYYVSSSTDVVSEAAGQGTDRIYTSSNYVLATGVSVETLSTDNNAGTVAITLVGNEIANNIYGNAGNNSLYGSGGNDTLTGLEGDDILNGGIGTDTMSGGLGNDWYYVSSSTDVVSEAAGQGTDRIYTSSNYVLATGVSVETLSTDNNAGTVAITLVGNEIANNLYGNAGNNNLFGGGGNDVLIGHEGDDTLNGGTGSDTMAGGLGNDSFYVDSSTDVVSEAAGQGTDRVYTSSNYTLAAGVSVETLSTDNNAGTAAINLTGNELANNIYGNAGNNSLYGSGGNDTLIGLEGDDILNGGIGTDTMSGGLGNDWYYVSSSTDVVSEAAGQGTDRIYTSSNYVLATGVSVETLSTDNNVGTVAITLVGNEIANNLYGNAGNNNLFGSDGNDVIIALDGNDMLNGGAGADTLSGGEGADTFVFANAGGLGNIDTIGDYSVADDVIHLDDAVFTGLAAGMLAAGAFNTGAAASQADDRIIYNSATGALLFDADGSGAGAAIQFAMFAGGLALTASEFLVI